MAELKMTGIFEKIQACIENPLPDIPDGHFLTGIIGDRPSQYAKSPSIWNAVFKEMNLPALYAAFDVKPDKLSALVAALVECARYLGGSVTVPYKIAIIEYLDSLDDKAKQIGAVNTIVRDSDGRLAGYNTDGKGGVDALTKVQPGLSQPFIEDLRRSTILMLGAGGAARALAFYLAEGIGPSGTLLIANRDPRKSESLAQSVYREYKNSAAVGVEDIEAKIRNVDILINATICGQSGIRAVTDGSTCLEPFSPLAVADPASLPSGVSADPMEFQREWFRTNLSRIESNNSLSLRIISRLKPSASVFDVIYSPLETVFLRHARWAGFRTLNGKSMNVAQAADAIFNRVFKSYLLSRGLHTPNVYQRIVETMYSVW